MTADPARLQSWLEVLCRMLPGLAEAVLITDAGAGPVTSARWPAAGEPGENLVSAATLAASQQKSVTTTLASGAGADAAVDTIFALPLGKPEELAATLAILVNIKPSQQSIVMQILHWGEDWLGLLLQQPAGANAPSAAAARRSLLPSGRGSLVLLALLLVAGLMAVIPGTYRVTAAASLEGQTQRVIVAPFDGYIASAAARAGETVTAGEIIAQLDTEELRLQQQRYAAEKNEYDRQYRQALVERDKTQAHIFKSQVGQADAQLRLVEKKIERSALVASLDGVIISGDLSRSLGAPVRTGDVLFEVAPLDEYRLIILVDEKQVADVRAGMAGQLTLKALPGDALAFTVHKVSPVFEEQASGIAYRVEARLDDSPAELRPGMQGVARIEIEPRSYLWIYLHELVDVLRLWAWRWMP